MAHFIVQITKTSRNAGRVGDWMRYDHKIHDFDSAEEAKAWVWENYVSNRYDGLFGGKRRSVFVDTESRGTIQSGWIFSGKEEQQDRSRANGRSTVYLQDWVTIAEVTVERREGKQGECKSVDVRTIGKIKAEA